MKEFNLEAALNGEPVKLANGNKAIVYYRIPDEFIFDDGSRVEFPLRGIIFYKDGYIEDSFPSWKDDGTFRNQGNYNIIGMWEKPKISIEDLPKPFTPEETQHYYYINGGYIECEDEYASKNDFDSKAAKRGNCFRTKEDAQKWLDFMKSMME